MHLGSFQPVCDEGQTLRLNIWKQQYRGVEGVKQRAIKKKKKKSGEKQTDHTGQHSSVQSHSLPLCFPSPTTHGRV